MALLSSAAAGVLLLQFGTSALAYSSVDLNLLDQDYTNLSLATALVRNYQYNSGNVTATASTFSGAVDVFHDLTASGFSTLSGAFETSSNSITGTAYGNTVTNTVSAGTTPSFDDSSAVANLQANTGDVSANSDDASITTLIESTGVDQYSGSSYYPVRTLDGTVTMDGNEISTSATANHAVNTIEIPDAVSLYGNADLATTDMSIWDRYDDVSGNSVTDLLVDADLAIVNGQSNESGDVWGVDANTSGALIQAKIQSVDGASVALTGNTISSTGIGNSVNSTISTGDNVATIDTTLALASMQENDDGSVNARTDDSTIELKAGYDATEYLSWSGGEWSYYSGAHQVDDSTLLIQDANITSLARGNDATQTLELTANDINSGFNGAGYIDTQSGGLIFVDGTATVTNLQLRSDSDTSADVNNGSIRIVTTENESGYMSDNTMTVDGGNFDATAVGNRGISQAVSLDGNTVGTGVQVASLQMDSSGSSVTATVDYSDVGIDAWDDYLDNSSTTVKNGMTRALAINNASASAIDVSSNAMSLSETYSGAVWINGPYEMMSGNSSVEAAYASVTGQLTEGDTSAYANQNRYYNASDDYTSGSSMLTHDNTQLAAAIGNDASNGITLSMNSVATVDSNDSGSSSGIAALASVVTIQEALGADIIAQSFSSGSVMRTDGGDVWNSTLATDNNIVQALAIGNRITENSVTVDTISLDTAYDYNSSGAAPRLSDDSWGAVAASNLALGWQYTSGSSVVASLTDSTFFMDSPSTSTEIDTIAWDVDQSTLSADGNQLLASATGNSSANSVDVTAGSDLASSTGAANFQGLESDTMDTISAFIGEGGSGGDSGVFVRAWNDVNDSALSVSDNVTAGTVTGNLATNAVSVQADQLWISSDQGNDAYVDSSETSADNMVYNHQFVDGMGLLSFVNGSFAIETNAYRTMSDSTFTVAGNTQSATATGNSASNALALEATSLESTAGLSSSQYANTYMGSWSDLHLYAPVAVDGSTVTIADNTSIATSTANLVSNVVDLSGTNVGIDGADDAYGSPWNDNSADAASALYNYQSSSSQVLAQADLVAFNDHAGISDEWGIRNSTVSFDNNASIAQATANRANNTMTLDATNLSLDGMIVNDQWSDSSVDADATSSVNMVETARNAADAAMVDSSVSVSNNSTQAKAIGNVSTNALALNATNVTGGDDRANTDGDNLWATYGVNNGQYNDGSVEAHVYDVSYTTSLNPLNDQTAMSDSQVSVTGNTATAQAIGNATSNSLTATTLSNDSANYGISNNQENNGDVSARVSNSTIGVIAVGGISNSTSRVTSNALGAGSKQPKRHIRRFGCAI
jgi:hypothetical protein